MISQSELEGVPAHREAAIILHKLLTDTDGNLAEEFKLLLTIESELKEQFIKLLRTLHFSWYLDYQRILNVPALLTLDGLAECLLMGTDGQKLLEQKRPIVSEFRQWLQKVEPFRTFTSEGLREFSRDYEEYDVAYYYTAVVGVLSLELLVDNFKGWHEVQREANAEAKGGAQQEASEVLGERKIPISQDLNVERSNAALAGQTQGMTTFAPSNSQDLTAPALKEIGQSKPADDYTLLRGYATTELKGDERRLLEALFDKNGSLPFVDMMVLFNWQEPCDPAWGSLRYRLNKKLKRHRFKLETHDRRARLIHIPLDGSARNSH